MTQFIIAVFLEKEITIMKKINKKYNEILRQADIAIGRKEVVRLLKRAAKVRCFIDEKTAA